MHSNILDSVAFAVQRQELRIFLQRFHDPIMQEGPEAPDLFVGSGGMDPIGEEYDHHILFQIHPDGGARKPKMPHAVL